MGPVAALLGSLVIVGLFVALAAAWDAPIYLACAATILIGVVAATTITIRRHH
jgi:hypothetical protein